MFGMKVGPVQVLPCTRLCNAVYQSVSRRVYRVDYEPQFSDLREADMIESNANQGNNSGK